METLLSGETERTMRLVREHGTRTSSASTHRRASTDSCPRREAFAEIDLAARMRELLDDIASGRFADEWDAERDAGYPVLNDLRERHAGASVAEFEKALRDQLGQGAVQQS